MMGTVCSVGPAKPAVPEADKFQVMDLPILQYNIYRLAQKPRQRLFQCGAIVPALFLCHKDLNQQRNY